MGSAASPFIIDDAIVGLAQPLTEALNQLASGLRRACDLVEELGRCEEFYLDLAGGPNGRTAGPVFHDAHLSYKLPRPNRAEKDGLAIEFSDNIDGTAEQTKNTVRRISLSEEDLAFGEVPASHCDPVNREQSGGPRRRCQIIARNLRALPSSCVLSGRSGRSLAINPAAAQTGLPPPYAAIAGAFRSVTGPRHDQED
jgi:hypothetical protein